MTSTRHEELITRLEASSGDRELDAAIAVAIFVTKSTDDDLVYARERALDGSDATHPGHYFIKSRSGANTRAAPHYTTSIDAALTLVPEKYLAFGVYFATSKSAGFPPATAEFYSGVNSIDHIGQGKTAALSICIASLKARTAQ